MELGLYRHKNGMWFMKVGEEKLYFRTHQTATAFKNLIAKTFKTLKGVKVYEIVDLYETIKYGDL